MVEITFPPCLCSPWQTSTSHTRISSFPFSLADGGSFEATSSLSSSSGGYCTATSTWSAEEIRSPGPREKAALVNPSSLPSSPPPPAALLLLLPLLMQSSLLLLLLMEVEAPPVVVSLDERRLFSRHHQKSCEHAFTTRPSCFAISSPGSTPSKFDLLPSPLFYYAQVRGFPALRGPSAPVY